MAEESKCATQYRMNARVNTTKPNSIKGSPECRWLGNWDTFCHSEYEMHLVSRGRANSYTEHDAICLICMNATKIQPSMHYVVKMRCLEIRAHGHANRGNGICNAMAKMAYRMQHGLTLTWESLRHTHIRGRWMKMRCLEMRAHVHANRGPTLRHRNATLMRHGKDMEYDMQTCNS